MITKNDIENIKKEIVKFAKDNNLGKDFSIFYNGKLFTYKVSHKNYKYYAKTYEDINPLEYCEYFPEDFILGLAYDGTFYEMINGYFGSTIYDKLSDLFRKYDMYLEHCDSCHAALVYDGDDEVEYTVFKKEKIEYIYRQDEAPTEVFKKIMSLWHSLSSEYGDKGGCVIGAYMEFDYKDKKYRVSPQSPYQGSLSWESSVDFIKQAFEKMGATNVYFNYGRLD